MRRRSRHLVAEGILAELNQTLIDESFALRLLAPASEYPDGLSREATYETVKIDTHAHVDFMPTYNMDLIEEAYQDLLTHLLVPLDRAFLGCLEKLPARQFSMFTPETLQEAETSQPEAGHLIVAFDVWNDIVTDAGFASTIKPETLHKNVLAGHLGRLSKQHVSTDAYRNETARALLDGSWFLTPFMIGTIEGNCLLDIKDSKPVVHMNFTMKIDTSHVVRGQMVRQ